MTRTALLLAVLFVCLAGRPALAQFAEDAVVQNATVVLEQAMATPGKAIPQAMLKDAQGVAIIPNVIKGGLIVGARHGNGVLVTRDADGNWQAPVFVTLSGGNIGWQIGVQASDLVLVFKTPQSIQGIMNGKFTIGADASAAAGPVGRQTAAATDGRLQAEIYTYSRSRGLFAGVSIDGSVIQLDPVANAMYYRSAAPGQPPVAPQSATRLVSEIAKYAGPAAQVVQVAAVAQVPLQPAPLQPAPLQPAQWQAAAEPQPLAGAQPAAVQRQLVQAANRMFERLDPQWSNFLALPPEIFHGRQPALANLEACLARFDKVAADTQYQQLTATPDFQQVHAELRAYVAAVRQAERQIQLPPPPAAASGATPAAENRLNLRIPDFQPVETPPASNVREPSRPINEGNVGFNRLPM